MRANYKTSVNPPPRGPLGDLITVLSYARGAEVYGGIAINYSVASKRAKFVILYIIIYIYSNCSSSVYIIYLNSIRQST